MHWMHLIAHFLCLTLDNENGASLNLTPEEFSALKSLSKNKNLIIQKKVTLLPLLTKAIISKKCEISYLIVANLLNFR